MSPDLPPYAAAFHGISGAPIILVKGRQGFWLLLSGEHPDDFNRRHGVSPAQREAMILGSMFGFNVPGADPAMFQGAPEKAADEPEDIKAALSAALRELEFEPLRAESERITALTIQRQDLAEQLHDMDCERRSLQDEIERLEGHRRSRIRSEHLRVIERWKARTDRRKLLKDILEQRRRGDVADDFGIF